MRPLALLTVLLLGLTACENGPRGHRGSSPEDGGTKVTTAVPAMEARAVFLQDLIDAEIILNRTGFGARGPNSGGPPGDAAGPARGGRSDGSQRSHGGARGRRGGPMGDSNAGAGSETRGGDSDGRVATLRASNEAPVSFHLRLTNRGSSPVEVAVPDFNSELGNFVVQPAKVTLPVNEPVEMDPMISRLGLRDAEIPLTVRLRVGGKSETQVITLRPIQSPLPDSSLPASQLPSVAVPAP